MQAEGQDVLVLVMGKDYIKMAPKSTRFPSHCYRPKSVVTVLDAAGGIEYRGWSIKPQSPAKGDFVQNKKFAEESELWDMTYI